MKFATFRTDADRRAAASRAVEEREGWWVRFGDELFVYSANGKWDEVSAAFGAEARSLGQPEGEVRKGAMHLVLQKGRTFQLENPDVRVLLDKGRYLVVDLPKDAARRLGGREEPCFRIEPLAENSVVFETRPRREAPPPAEPHMVEAVAALDRAVFEEALTRLVGFRTRHSTSDPFVEAADWARGRFEAWGYATETESVDVGSAESRNVIARKAGVGGDGRGVVLIVAHLDSINQPGGPDAPAPGADDNASGSAGALALAHALSAHALFHDLTIILFGGEEQGLHGSIQHVAALSDNERQRIRAVLNMDMIGSVNVVPEAVLLEGAPLSQSMIDALALAAEQFTGLFVQTSLNPFASDHVPFIEAGIPAVLTIEGADGANEAIHTINDTLDRIRIDYAIEILRMNLGYLAAEAGVTSTVTACGCAAGPGVSPEMAAGLNAVSAHYQALFAQYARLQRDGGLAPGDLANWQAALAAHDALMADAGLAAERPDGVR